MFPLVAPSARRSPISDRRSSTEITMVLATPMPPTSRDTADRSRACTWRRRPGRPCRRPRARRSTNSWRRAGSPPPCPGRRHRSRRRRPARRSSAGGHRTGPANPPVPGPVPVGLTTGCNRRFVLHHSVGSRHGPFLREQRFRQGFAPRPGVFARVRPVAHGPRPHVGGPGNTRPEARARRASGSVVPHRFAGRYKRLASCIQLRSGTDALTPEGRL